MGIEGQELSLIFDIINDHFHLLQHFKGAKNMPKSSFMSTLSSYCSSNGLLRGFLLFFNKNNKNQLRRIMDRNSPKEDFDTQLLSNEISQPSRPLLESSHELPTIHHIMDQIHQEVISAKNLPRNMPTNHPSINCKKWAKKQTHDFFLLLAKVGPDFTCMERHTLFAGNRSKRELKNKFRKEQKKDGVKVNRCLDSYYDGSSAKNIEE